MGVGRRPLLSEFWAVQTAEKEKTFGIFYPGRQEAVREKSVSANRLNNADITLTQGRELL